jgi:ABC-type Fe3+-siderophore transport system permease subunit
MTTTADIKKLYSKGKKKKILVILSLFLALILNRYSFAESRRCVARSWRGNKCCFIKNVSLSTNQPRNNSRPNNYLDHTPARIVMAIIAGAGLAAAGATMQGILRNPLFPPMC